MSNLKDIVPPLELCKKIPEGEFKESVMVYVPCSNGRDFKLRQRTFFLEASHNGILPAPLLQEILEELHKQQEDVFLKWSEHAYHEWLVNAYSHNQDDFQAHDKNSATAAMKVYLQLKGIENE